MRLTLDEIENLIKTFEEKGLVLLYLKDNYIKNENAAPTVFKSYTDIRLDHLPKLKANNYDVVEVIFDEKVYAGILYLYPLKYRKPYNQSSFIEIDKILNAYNELNKRSKRERYLISCSEQYLKLNDGTIKPILSFGDRITYDKWNEIKGKLDKNKKISYRNSECGIIVFVDLRPGGENYITRFYRNTDLITLLVGRKVTDKIKIAPDFIGTLDVIQVDEPEKLLFEYSRANSRLVILGDDLSEEYKKALQQIKTYDSFTRFMMITNIDLSKKDEFISTVARTYNSDNWNLKDY